MLQIGQQLSQQSLKIRGKFDFCNKNPVFLGLTGTQFMKRPNFAGFRAERWWH